MRKYLEESCSIDEKLKTKLTELKFFEEEKVDYVIDYPILFTNIVNKILSCVFFNLYLKIKSFTIASFS